MASQVDVCNLALGKLGQDVAIASISENSKPARVFNRQWAIVRDLVLEEHSWPFALKAMPLEEVLETPFPGWERRYAYPSDCVRALSVCDEAGVRYGLRGYAACGWGEWERFSFPGRQPWQVTFGDQSTAIATDIEDAYLIYVARVEEVPRYPASFVDALASRLALETAPQIMGELGLRAQGNLQQAYELARAKAAANALNEAEEDPPATTPSVAARFS